MSLQIVKMTFGSHLYGTNTPASDMDFKGVYVPEGRDILLQREKEVICSTTKSKDRLKNDNTDTDTEIYSLRKFLNLVTQGQTVVLDMLFTPSQFEIGSTSYIWRDIQANKGKLLSSKYASFVGYCRTQANKYGIKGSRMAAAKSIVNFLEPIVESHGGRFKLDDISHLILDPGGCGYISIVEQEDRSTGKVAKYLSVCDRKIPLTASVKTAYDCYKKLYDEYGERARAAEKNEGIDWKALSHAVRIGRQAIELLTTGTVVFPRVDAQHLLKIKCGALAYNAVSAEIEELLETIETVAKNSVLPAEPDVKWVDDFIVSHYGYSVRKSMQ